MKLTAKVAAAASIGLVGLVALSAFQGKPALKSAVRTAKPGLATIATKQISQMNPAALAQMGKMVTEMVGPNATPKDYRKLANEVACGLAVRHDNLFLKNAACANAEWYGPNRQTFIPGKTDLPEHLKGTYPGDFGFDPFGLGRDDLQLRSEEELIHARWAMLGVVGILVPDLLAKSGVAIEPKWWKVGLELVKGKPIDYLGNPEWVHASNIGAILAIQVLLMSTAEVWKGYWITEPGSKGMYPGGPFDPLGFAKDPKKAEELKIKEIKNGRLAMIAMLGFYAQAFATGKTPLDNLADHVSNPFVNHW